MKMRFEEHPSYLKISIQDLSNDIEKLIVEHSAQEIVEVAEKSRLMEKKFIMEMSLAIRKK